MEETVSKKLENGILILTVNRPEKLNALNSDVINRLSALLDDAAQNKEVKSIVITGAGPKSFVAGADISQFPAMDSKAGNELARLGHETVFNKIENFPKPVVAAVNGFALGGGCELAMACHIRIASNHAKFGQPEVNLGLIPGYGGTQRLVHLAGKGKAMELCLSGNMIDATEAHRIGLVNQVTTLEELLPTTLKLLNTINQKAPLAIKAVIGLVNKAVYDTANGLTAEVEGFGELFDTQDAKEGTTAFLEKRAANFKGA